MRSGGGCRAVGISGAEPPCRSQTSDDRLRDAILASFPARAMFPSHAKASILGPRTPYSSALASWIPPPMSHASPSVTAILLTYDCEAFAAEALRSALAQDHPEPIEILVSDDASTDGTFDVIRREADRYRGPHRVRVQQRERNSGSKSAHLNHVFPLASGDILICFDGDDISESSRVRRIVERFRSDPRAQAVFSQFSVIDGLGRARGAGSVPHPPCDANTSAWFAQVDAYAAGATLAVRRSVVTSFGPLDPEIHEDVVLPFRASLLGETAFLAEPLVRARRHAASMTADFEQLASFEDYRSRQLRGIAQARRNAVSRLADLRKVQALMPHRAHEFEALRGIVQHSLAVAESTAQLVSPSFVTRVSALIRLIRVGAYREELWQHAGLALLPGAYLRYKRRALGVRRRTPRERS
jgi:glycosyltransferase involved in cell wall biosynthesis